MSLKIFVYGTLRTNQYYHHLIQDQISSVVNATYQGTLYHLPYNYPAIVNGPGRVSGELMEFTNEASVLAILDELEGYRGPGQDNEYERIDGQVRLEDGTLTSCQLYVYPERKKDWLQREAILVSCGDWEQWKTQCKS